MKRVRIHKPGRQLEPSWRQELPADPRDPDVVRAKVLARAGRPGRGRPVTPAGTAGASGRPDDARPATGTGLAGLASAPRRFRLAARRPLGSGPDVPGPLPAWHHDASRADRTQAVMPPSRDSYGRRSR